MRSFKVRNRTLNPTGHALICTPLVARSASALATELESILSKGPDLIEWRVDYFDEIVQTNRVIDVVRAIRRVSGEIPLIFTRRAPGEGGEATGLAEEAVVALYEEVCASGAVDIIDCELSWAANHRARLRAASRAHDVAMIMSYHNFENTPPCAELVDKIAQAAREGADIAKVAVMPQTPGDVLVLLEATLAASSQVQIPLITMSMGGMGALTRLCGWIYGSAVTFAVGENSSAPGQIPINELRLALATMERATSV